MTQNRYLYSNRLALLLEKEGVLDDIKLRISTYFDEFIIDEVQDIAGRGFTFLENLMENPLDMLFVGGFYQHTFDTSRDGKANGTLFDDKKKYEARFTNRPAFSVRAPIIARVETSSLASLLAAGGHLRLVLTRPVTTWRRTRRMLSLTVTIPAETVLPFAVWYGRQERRFYERVLRYYGIYP